MKKLFMVILVVFAMLLAVCSYAKDLSFGNKSFVITEEGKGIIVETRNVMFRVTSTGDVEKKMWKTINENQDTNVILFHNSSETYNYIVLTVDDSIKKDMKKMQMNTDNGFTLTYYSNQDLLEITHPKIHLKVLACGEMKVEKWQLIY
jgi:hypothetical protein